MFEIDWIVCRGHERPVVDGRVWCPGHELTDELRDTRVEGCFDCRHLVATVLDRRPEGMCETAAS